jgi:hypothetical protein
MNVSPDGDATAGPEAGEQGANSRRGKAAWLRPLVLTLAGLTLICLLGCLVVALANGPLAPSSAPTGLPITVCAGAAFQPRFQAGVVWVSAISSYLPPVAASPYSVCFRLPARRIPGTPWGEWVFPP